MTVQEWQAKIIGRAAEAVGVWIETTPDDKLGWVPPVEGAAGIRTVYQQIEEMEGVNLGIAAQLSGQSAGEAGHGESDNSITSKAQAVQRLKASASRLAAVVRDMPDSAFVQTYDMGFAKMSGAVMIELAANNMMYHGGQINYLQMLAGDKEFHFPDSFFTF